MLTTIPFSECRWHNPPICIRPVWRMITPTTTTVTVESCLESWFLTPMTLDVDPSTNYPIVTVGCRPPKSPNDTIRKCIHSESNSGLSQNNANNKSIYQQFNKISKTNVVQNINKCNYLFRFCNFFNLEVLFTKIFEFTLFNYFSINSWIRFLLSILNSIGWNLF